MVFDEVGKSSSAMSVLRDALMLRVSRVRRGDDVGGRGWLPDCVGGRPFRRRCEEREAGMTSGLVPEE